MSGDIIPANFGLVTAENCQYRVCKLGMIGQK